MIKGVIILFSLTSIYIFSALAFAGADVSRGILQTFVPSVAIVDRLQNIINDLGRQRARQRENEERAERMRQAGIELNRLYDDFKNLPRVNRTSEVRDIFMRNAARILYRYSEHHPIARSRFNNENNLVTKCHFGNIIYAVQPFDDEIRNFLLQRCHQSEGSLAGFSRILLDTSGILDFTQVASIAEFGGRTDERNRADELDFSEVISNLDQLELDLTRQNLRIFINEDQLGAEHYKEDIDLFILDPLFISILDQSAITYIQQELHFSELIFQQAESLVSTAQNEFVYLAQLMSRLGSGIIDNLDESFCNLRNRAYETPFHIPLERSDITRLIFQNPRLRKSLVEQSLNLLDEYLSSSQSRRLSSWNDYITNLFQSAISNEFSEEERNLILNLRNRIISGGAQIIAATNNNTERRTENESVFLSAFETFGIMN